MWIKEKDAHGNETERLRVVTSFVKGFGSGAGRVELWYGTLAENITQAVAASILRETLVRLHDHGFEVVLHTHDEIVLECDERYAQRIGSGLKAAMLELPEWAEGLPLDVDIEQGPYYTK